MLLTPDEIAARTTLSAQGIIAAWYLRDSQLEIYELIMREKYPFIEAARRFGKTTSLIAFVLEQLRMNPGWICRWCFPNKNQAREVMIPEMEKIQEFTPAHLKFEYKTVDSVFEGPPAQRRDATVRSKLYIRGVNEDRGNSARGPAANILICDEYGFWNDPSYVVRSCLLPQLEGQEGRWLIKASTPAEELGHAYYKEKKEAQRRGKFISKTIYDKETLTEEELKEIIEESGGIDSPSFRRERLCEEIADPELLVVPEYLDTMAGNVVPDDYPRPEFFTPYVGGDSGADDNTALLFGYYDFLKAEFVIEEELVVNGKTTGTITSLAKLMELNLWATDRSIDYMSYASDLENPENREKIHKLWLSKLDRKPKSRVYDSDKQLIFDLYGDYKYPMLPADKTDKRAAIHALRAEIGARRIKIKEKCVNSREQLRVGMWKDELKIDFRRTEGLGHLDAIAAAIYLNRSIDTNLNPIPLFPGASPYTHHIPPVSDSQARSTEEALKKLFGPKRRIR
jgi:hypothetical protein